MRTHKVCPVRLEEGQSAPVFLLPHTISHHCQTDAFQGLALCQIQFGKLFSICVCLCVPLVPAPVGEEALMTGFSLHLGVQGHLEDAWTSTPSPSWRSWRRPRGENVTSS